jgi:SOS-response transcriptional repressor LexA
MRPELGVVKVVGDGLRPLASHGQLIVVDTSGREPADGDLAIVTANDGRAYAMRFSREEDQVTLLSVDHESDQKPVHLSWRKDVAQAHVIVGVLFE